MAFNIFDLIEFAVSFNIFDKLRFSIADIDGFTSSPLAQRNASNTDSSLEHQHFLVLYSLVLKDDKPWQDDIGIPQSQPFEAVGKGIDISYCDFHFEGIVQDDVSVAKTEDDAVWLGKGKGLLAR